MDDTPLKKNVSDKEINLEDENYTAKKKISKKNNNIKHCSWSCINCCNNRISFYCI